MIRFLVIALVLSLVSCDLKLTRPSAPKGVISQDTMKMILKEEILVGTFVEENYNGLGQYHKILTASSHAILDKYGIAFDRFKESLDFYTLRDDLMLEMYEEIKEEVESQK